MYIDSIFYSDDGDVFLYIEWRHNSGKGMEQCLFVERQLDYSMFIILKHRRNLRCSC
jgi:hypothetical protein